MTRLSMLFPLGVLTLLSLGTVQAATIVLPGTPCGNPAVSCAGGNTTQPVFTSNFTPGTLNTNIANDPGVTVLNQFVTPGTVILCELTTCSTTVPQSQWSDVVVFFDLANGQGSGALMYADGENGVALPPGFMLSANAQAIVEVLVGAGTDADFTNYQVPGAIYMIHSDAQSPEIPDPETPEPSTLALMGFGLAVAGIVHRCRRA